MCESLFWKLISYLSDKQQVSKLSNLIQPEQRYRVSGYIPDYNARNGIKCAV
jgi:hypothetical protein